MRWTMSFSATAWPDAMLIGPVTSLSSKRHERIGDVGGVADSRAPGCRARSAPARRRGAIGSRRRRGDPDARAVRTERRCGPTRSSGRPGRARTSAAAARACTCRRPCAARTASGPPRSSRSSSRTRGTTRRRRRGCRLPRLNAATSSRLARTQSKFSGAAAQLPGAMYQARCSRCAGAARSGRPRAPGLASSRLAWCQRTPVAIGRRRFRRTACTSQPRATSSGSAWRPTQPVAPVTSTRFMTVRAGSPATLGPSGRSRAGRCRATRCRIAGRSSGRRARRRDGRAASRGRSLRCRPRA